MNTKAVFSDTSERYILYKREESLDVLSIRIRVFKDDDLNIFLCYGHFKVKMHFEYSKNCFSYYNSTVNVTDKILEYYFEIQDAGKIVYFDKKGIRDETSPEYAFRFDSSFSVPEWSKGAVIYQILVDRFCNGNTDTNVLDNEYRYINEYSKSVDWDGRPKEFDVHRFFGGDLEGVRKKLPYLRNLGIEAIYFNPLFVSPSNHKYDAQDYDYIDPHFTVIKNDGGDCLCEGEKNNKNASKYIKRVTDKDNLEASNKYFAEFVEEAHENGIRIILDGVFNHCGSFHKWLDAEGIYEDSEDYPPGAYKSESSPYKDFFEFEKDSWPDNDTYEGWWGHKTLPKLNYEKSEMLFNYVLGIGKKWVSPPFNVDGWRLDVAADLGHSEEYNHFFWKEFRKAVKGEKKECIILAEHYGDARPWLLGDEWDTIMNYDAFMDPVSLFLTGMEKHSDKRFPAAKGDGKLFEQTMLEKMSSFMAPSLLSAMNQISNHDHSRFLTRTNETVGRLNTLGHEAAEEGIDYAVFRQGVTIQFTWPGCPAVYYGDEAGMCGFTDPDNRRPYPWGKVNENLIDFHRDIIYIHKNSRALKIGSFVFLDTGENFISYARFTEEEKVIVIINTDPKEKVLSIPIWRAEVKNGAILKREMITTESGYSILPKYKECKNGYLCETMYPKSSVIYRWKENL